MEGVDGEKRAMGGKKRETGPKSFGCRREGQGYRSRSVKEQRDVKRLAGV